MIKPDKDTVIGFLLVFIGFIAPAIYGLVIVGQSLFDNAPDHTTSIAQNEPAPQTTVTSDSVLAELNARRTAQGKKALVLDERLNRAAKAYTDSTSTAKKSYEYIYDHYPKSRAGYVYSEYAGLCARFDSKAVVDNLVNENSLDDKYSLVGINVLQDTSKPGDQYCKGKVAAQFVQVREIVETPFRPPRNYSRERVGAICEDGTRSYATGSGACSWHGGVSEWLYE